MNPFNLEKQMKIRRYRNVIPHKFRCLLCDNPYKYWYAHDHTGDVMSVVSLNTHMESQLVITSSLTLQEFTISKMPTSVANFLTLNDPISLSTLKELTDMATWYNALEEAMCYYNATAMAFPPCWDLSQEQDEECQVSCTMIGEVPVNKDEFCIRFIQIAIPNTLSVTIIPIMAEAIDDFRCTFRRIVDVSKEKIKSEKSSAKLVKACPEGNEDYDFCGTLNDILAS